MNANAQTTRCCMPACSPPPLPSSRGSLPATGRSMFSRHSSWASNSRLCIATLQGRASRVTTSAGPTSASTEPSAAIDSTVERITSAGQDALNSFLVKRNKPGSTDASSSSRQSEPADATARPAKKVGRMQQRLEQRQQSKREESGSDVPPGPSRAPPSPRQQSDFQDRRPGPNSSPRIGLRDSSSRGSRDTQGSSSSNNMRTRSEENRFQGPDRAGPAYNSRPGPAGGGGMAVGYGSARTYKREEQILPAAPSYWQEDRGVGSSRFPAPATDRNAPEAALGLPVR